MTTETGAFVTAPEAKPSREELKKRLVAFWESQAANRDTELDENAVSLRIRGKLAACIPEGSRILDAACGTCANSAWYSAQGRYFGTDLSEGFLRLGKKLESRLCCADAERLPFADKSFDAVSFTYALEHTVEPESVLKELCRVTREKGRVLLLGPSWDLPFWYPNALKSRSNVRGWRLRYTISRLRGQLAGWLLGRLPFEMMDEPDAFHRPFEADSDAVYVVWSYEVIRQMKRTGFRLMHSEVDDRLIGTKFAVKLLMRLLFLLPLYRLAGSTVLMVFERD